ncbi:MAG: proline dehydrogenase family protein [Frankia sp.]
MLGRGPILAAAHSRRVRDLMTTAPVTAGVVRRFVAGDNDAAALSVAAALAARGLTVSLDLLGEDTTDRAGARTAAHAYVVLLDGVAASGLAGSVEASVKLSALGARIDPAMALEHARLVCAAARDAGTTVTFDAEDHTTTDLTLAVVRDLRRDFPGVGAVVQAQLRRSEGDCRDLAGPGSRVRLCKGAYAEPASVAFTARRAVAASYARCLGVLMAGDGHPLVATHDPALIDLTLRLADRFRPAVGGAPPGAEGYEFQMLYGVRPLEQNRLAAQGHPVRVYVPYGSEWYPYLMRRLAERPANLTFFLRSLRGDA